MQSKSSNRLKKLTTAIAFSLATMVGCGFLASEVMGEGDLASLTAQAEGGDLLAQRKLGERYLLGREGAPRNPTEAVRWLELAANGDDAHAHYLLGWHYQRAADPATQDRVIHHYRRAAALGHTTSQAIYAQLMISYATKNNLADSVRADYYSRAVGLLQNAADANNTTAMTALGRLKYEGQVLPRDEPAALKLFERAAAAGDARAAHLLASVFLNPKNPHHDEGQGIRYLTQAAKGNIGVAMLDLGQRYEEGRGIGRDLETALYWTDRAVRAGARDAAPHALRVSQALAKQREQSVVAQVKRTEEENSLLAQDVLKKNESLAERAKELDTARAQLDQQADQITTLSIEIAALKEQKAAAEHELAALRKTASADRARVVALETQVARADQRNAELLAQLEANRSVIAQLTAERNAAIARADTLVRMQQPPTRVAAVPEPPSAAAPLAPPRKPAVPEARRQSPVVPLELEDRVAAPAAPTRAVSVVAAVPKIEDARALNQKGLEAIRTGAHESAFDYFGRAAAAGDAGGMNNLGLLYMKGMGGTVDTQRAIELFEQAVARGNAAAANNLGFLYHHGLEGVAPDARRAQHWYERAIAMGNRSAVTQLEALRGTKLSAL